MLEKEPFVARFERNNVPATAFTIDTPPLDDPRPLVITQLSVKAGLTAAELVEVGFHYSGDYYPITQVSLASTDLIQSQRVMVFLPTGARLRIAVSEPTAGDDFTICVYGYYDIGS